MDIRESRKNFNIMAKKCEGAYYIVRYTQGFLKSPVVLCRNIKSRAEVVKRLEKAISIIGSISSEYGVMIRPGDKSQMVEIAMIIEESGVAVNDIRVQKDGLVYFRSRGDSDEFVQNTVEDILDEANIPYNESTVSVTRPDLIPQDKEDKFEDTSVNPPAFEYDKDDTVYLQTDKENVDSSITASVKDEDFELYQDMINNPSEYKSPEFKLIFDKLKLKYANKEVTLDDYISDMISKGTKYLSFDDFVSDMMDNGFSVEDISSIDEKLVVQLLK